MLLLTAPTGAHRPESSQADPEARAPAILLISIAGAMALLALGAAWLWIKNGATILLDIGQLFCF